MVSVPNELVKPGPYVPAITARLSEIHNEAGNTYLGFHDWTGVHGELGYCV
jgi:hypothetical protein